MFSQASAVLVLWLLGRCLYLFRYVLVPGIGLLFLVTGLVSVPLLSRVVEDACVLAFWVLFVRCLVLTHVPLCRFLTCFGVHQGEVLYGVQRYSVDGLIPLVVQIEGTGVGLVVV